MKSNIIILAGAPGSGKTTIAKVLQTKLDCPLIDFGWIREFHLDKKWKKANLKEENMSFENLVFIIKNYIHYGYRNIIVNDLNKDKVIKLTKIFKNSIIITLVVNQKELEKRVKTVGRDSGFKDVKMALEYNEEWKKARLKNELKIENSHKSTKKTVSEILRILQKWNI